jgi:uncharacterized protein (TIGR02001 family)
MMLDNAHASRVWRLVLMGAKGLREIKAHMTFKTQTQDFKPMKTLLMAATFMTALAAGGSAMADDGFSFNIGSGTSYKFRGIDQLVDDKLAVQGGVDYTKGKFYAGTWASNVDFGDGTDTEIDVYAGYKPSYGIVNFDIGATLYTYLNQPNGSHLSLAEIKLAASAPLAKATIGAAVYASIDNYDSTGKKDTRFADSLYAEINASYPLTETITLSGAMGNTKLAGGSFTTPSKTVINTDEYATLNVGATIAMTDNIAVDLRYWDTNRHDFGETFKAKTVASIKLTF